MGPTCSQCGDSHRTASDIDQLNIQIALTEEPLILSHSEHALSFAESRRHDNYPGRSRGGSQTTRMNEREKEEANDQNNYSFVHLLIPDTQNDRNFFLSYSYRELKIAPTAQCRPAFERLKRPSEKAGWPRIPNLEGTISDHRVLGQPQGWFAGRDGHLPRMGVQRLSRLREEILTTALPTSRWNYQRRIFATAVSDLKKAGVKIMYEKHVRESGRSIYFFDTAVNYLQVHTPL